MANHEFIRIFEADAGLMSEVFAFISGSLAACGISRENSAVLEMAADEIFSNIAKYSGSADAAVRLSVDGCEVALRFEDGGAPFDPLSAAQPDVSLGDGNGRAELPKAGGLGIRLAKSLMDGMSYSREGGRNVLILTKRLRGDERPDA
jgi:anti-sigma regulatory factor (Ser/Thr protein kinase)